MITEDAAQNKQGSFCLVFFSEKQFENNQKNNVLRLFMPNFSLKNGNKIYSSFRLMLFFTLVPLLFPKQK